MKTPTAIILLVFLAATIAAIFSADGYELYIIALVGLTAMVGIGLNVLVGLSGQISLGHVGFYAIGAYTGAILTTTYEWNFWLALPVAGVISGIAGTLLAIPALRVRGPYLAMITIAFGFVVEQGAAEWKGLTGGWNGIMFIPLPSAFDHEFAEFEVALLTTGLTVVFVLLFMRLSDSNWGRAMRAVRDSDIASQSIGLNPVMVRTMAFGLSAIVAGIAGAIFASMSSFISPGSFPFLQSILFLLVVLIGGSGTVLGPLVGALVVVLLPEFLSSLAEYRLLFMGALLLGVLLIAPHGIVGALEQRFRKAHSRCADGNGFDVAGYLSQAVQGGALEVETLTKSFGGVHAIENMTFRAMPGAITSIIGPNGAGKTTVLNLVGGFYKPDRGTVHLDGRDLAGDSSHKIARAGIARTYQTTQLFTDVPVIENVAIAMQRGRLDSVLSAIFGRRTGRDEENRIAQALLEFVGFTGPVEQNAGALPHVDRRLVEIARALAIRPQVLMLDEPAAGLNSEDTDKVAMLVKQIAATGIAVIIIEHDMHLVMGISDHIYVLDAGKLIAEGSPTDVRNNEDVRKAYLGESDFKHKARSDDWQPGEDSLLGVNRLTANYGAAPALTSVDVTVREGEFVAVLGANGAGKSTLMRTLSGLHPAHQGNILFMGKDITSYTANHIAGMRLVLVPEGRQVFPELSVIDNIKMGAFTRTDFNPEVEIEAMLQRFPKLRERAQIRAGLLSGGEQQMLAIARGLVAKPKLLMLDEPSLGLAPLLINELFQVLAELRDEGLTILLVDQMAGMALAIADHGYILESGHVTHAGTAPEIGQDSALERSYLGGD